MLLSHHQNANLPPAVIRVEANEDFTLTVGFSTGENGTLDMKPYLDFGLFQVLRDPHIFRTARVAFDTVAWDGGIDLDPDFVYRHRKSQAVPTEGGGLDHHFDQLAGVGPGRRASALAPTLERGSERRSSARTYD
jgi:hypothetical protein